ADDDGGGPNPATVDSRTSVVVTSSNDAPTADAGGPYTIDAGMDLVVDATATDPDPGTTFTYGWDLDRDGVSDFDTAAAMDTIPWMTLANLGFGPGTYDIDLIVSDDQGAVGTDTTQLTIGGQFVFAPETDGWADLYTFRSTSGPGGLDFFEFVDTVTGQRESWVVQTGIHSIVVFGSDDDDTLTIDFSSGASTLPAGGFTFQGNGQAAEDTLVLMGTRAADSVVHTFFDANSGLVDVTFDGATLTVNYSGLEPITDDLEAVARRFTFGDGSDQITLADEGTPNNGRLRLSSAGSSETVTFLAPTSSITIEADRGGDGDDTVTIAALDGHFTGTVSVVGGGGNDRLDGSAASVRLALEGGGGDDTLIGGAQADTLDGGAGTDQVEQTVDANQTLTDSQLIGRAVDQIAGIERAMLTGGAGANVLDASVFSGAVTLDGGAGNDTLIGAAGDDSLIGGTGIDQVQQAVDADQTLTNTLLTGWGQDTLSGIESAWMTGGAGANVLDASGFTWNSVTLDGGAGDDTLIGSLSSDSLIGGEGTDLVRQTVDANQTLTDTLLTGAGSDTLVGVEL
ncbi:MAG TPA: hypothetical protein EYP14_00890, partial [Planctomycetaceae bacterium]|nr:hypothetical protein [Planctomycetaceae bacterium]